MYQSCIIRYQFLFDVVIVYFVIWLPHPCLHPVWPCHASSQVAEFTYMSNKVVSLLGGEGTHGYPWEGASTDIAWQWSSTLATTLWVFWLLAGCATTGIWDFAVCHGWRQRGEPRTAKVLSSISWRQTRREKNIRTAKDLCHGGQSANKMGRQIRKRSR